MSATTIIPASRLATVLIAVFIVVGTRGGGIGPAVQRLVDGSVSRGLVHGGHHRPVLVVPKAHVEGIHDAKPEHAEMLASFDKER